MPRSRYTTEKTINRLRKAEVLVSEGRLVSAVEVDKKLGISEHTHYH